MNLAASPRRWLTHYPRLLAAYRDRGEDGLADVEERLRAEAAEQPGGKFGKLQAAYVPFVPLPPLDWRHRCGRCRFWVDHGPGEAGECMIVGREGDPLGGKAVHEEAGCALFVPPAGEPPFGWIGEQLHPTGADLVRGEYHPPEEFTGRRPRRGRGRRGGASRVGRDYDVGDAFAPEGARVGLERVAAGFSAPLDVVHDPADPGRLFVADQTGQVYVHEDGVRGDPLLDLSDRMVDLEMQYDERGLLGMALHPDFEDDGRLFVRYSAPRRSGTPQEYDHTEVLAAFRVDEDRSQIDPATESTLLTVPSPQFNHNGGALAFGPDGLLYLSMGDGGGEGDRGPGHVDGGNGQDVTENLLGGILRVDVDGGGEDGYAIPPENPFAGDAAGTGGGDAAGTGGGDATRGDGNDAETGLGEYYAWGLRNPWRMSFDSEGRLFVADVGQHLFEEIDLVERSGNYGWNVREGFHCFDPDTPTEPPETCPDESVRGEPFEDPILEYPHVHEGHVVGSAVVGGYVYEGTDLPALEGAYVFGDWATTQDRPSGRLFAAREDGGMWKMEELVVADTESGRPNRNVLSFGRGPDGELYACTSATHVPKGDTGAVYRLVER